MWLELLQEYAGLISPEQRQQQSDDASENPWQNEPAQTSPQLVVSRQEINHLLHTAYKEECMVSLMFRDDPTCYQSKIVHVDQAAQQFLLRQPWQDLMPNSISYAQREQMSFNLAAPYHMSSAVLTTTVLSEIDWQHKACYVAQIPKVIFNNEMRNFVRVRLTPSKKVQARIVFQTREVMCVDLIDLSENGFRIRLTPSQEKQFAQILISAGNQAPNYLSFILTLAEHTPIQLHARVRSRGGVSNAAHCEFGWEIMQISNKDTQILRRFVMRYSTFSV